MLLKILKKSGPLFRFCVEVYDDEGKMLFTVEEEFGNLWIRFIKLTKFRSALSFKVFVKKRNSDRFFTIYRKAGISQKYFVEDWLGKKICTFESKGLINSYWNIVDETGILIGKYVGKGFFVFNRQGGFVIDTFDNAIAEFDWGKPSFFKTPNECILTIKKVEEPMDNYIIGCSILKAFPLIIGEFMDSKKVFYKKVMDDLEKQGYEIESKIKGISKSHAKKPDYLAIYDNNIIIGEIKSPKEGPETSSWRQVQNGDSNQLRAVREKVRQLEQVDKNSKKVVGHVIVILGQLPEYKDCIKKTFELPPKCQNLNNINILFGYSVPKGQEENVECAFKLCKIKILNKVMGCNNVTFIYNVDNVNKVLESFARRFKRFWLTNI
jgi:hypothetical protein